MTDDHPTTGPDADVERTLAAALDDLVRDEHPPAELRTRVADALHHDPLPSRRWVPTAAAAAVLAIAVLGAVIGFGPADDEAGVATAPDPAPTTVPEPEVLGSRIDRTPSGTADADRADDTDDTDDTTTVTTAAVDENPSSPAPAPAGEAPKPTTAPATTAPPTTAAPCHRSTDPSCGPFRWEPTPTNHPATLTIHPPDGPITTDTPVDLVLEMHDPDGPVTLDCYSVSLDRPGLSTGTCNAVPQDCPERYGPWPPPDPQPGEAATTTSVEFHESGTYVITVDVSPPQGCDNVDPYRSGARTSVTVEVQPAG